MKPKRVVHAINLAQLAKTCMPYPPKGQFGKDRYLSALHKHWPYGPETSYAAFMMGTLNLKKLPRYLRSWQKSKEQLIAQIYKQVGQAMHYPMVLHPEGGYERQAIEAFAMWHLVASGWTYWQDPKEIPKPWLKTSLADARQSIKRRGERHGMTPAKLAAHFRGYWPKHGRYVEHRPSIEKMTKQQLQAVYLIVCDAFENQC